MMGDIISCGWLFVPEIELFWKSQRAKYAPNEDMAYAVYFFRLLPQSFVFDILYFGA